MVIKQSIKRVDVRGSQLLRTIPNSCSWKGINIKLHLFSSDGEAPASLHKVQVIETFLRMLKYLNPNLYWYSWWCYNICTYRENRERRIGIDRVKDAVEKCLQQVAESWQKLTIEHQQIFSWTWSKPWLRTPRKDERNRAWKKRPFVSGTRCNPWPSGSHAGSCRRGDQKFLSFAKV